MGHTVRTLHTSATSGASGLWQTYRHRRYAILGEGGQSNFSPATAIYYSFVTLATIGYGDIVPRSELARSLATMEAIMGQLYLAVMIARLVSLYVSGAGQGPQCEVRDGSEGSTPCNGMRRNE
jgi:hypothetical protein